MLARSTVKKHRNYRKRTNYVIAVCALVLFYVWLGHYAYSPVDSSSGNSPAAHDAGAGNRVTSRSHGLVAGFRNDIPIYTPSRVRTCHIADPDTKVVAVLCSSDPLERVSAFYRSEMVKRGWKIEEDPPRGNTGKTGSSVRFRGNKGGSLLNVQLTENTNETDIRIRLLPRQAAVIEDIPSS